MEPRRILVIANQTAVGNALRTELRRRTQEGPCKVTLVVPATPPQEHATWTDEEAYSLASERMTAAVEVFRGMGLDIEGIVGDASPAEAVADVLLTTPIDEIILSTLPPGVSRWLKQDISHRLERRFELPVTTVIAQGASVPSG